MLNCVSFWDIEYSECVLSPVSDSSGKGVGGYGRGIRISCK